MLRNEYLNQTFNFMPEILGTYDELAKNTKYEQYQDRIMDKSQYKEEGNVSFTVNNDILYYNIYNQSCFIKQIPLTLDIHFITVIKSQENENITLSNQPELKPIALVTDYFANMWTYTQSVKIIVDKIASDIGVLVVEKVDSYGKQQVFPMALMIGTSLFVPLILYLTFKATLSMFR